MLIKWLYGRLVPDEDGVYNAGHEYVDLGLSVYWATMNVGARYNYEYGKTCKWGETFVPWLLKPILWGWYFMKVLGWLFLFAITFGAYIDAKFDLEEVLSYRWHGLLYKFSRYTTDTKLAKHPDYQSTLHLCDDAVHCRMGGDWRMPTVDEMGELLEQCSWQAVMINHTIPAYRVTGPNGNTILLPEKDLWTSSLCQNNEWAYGLILCSNRDDRRPFIANCGRLGLLYVRGVLDRPENADEE